MADTFSRFSTKIDSPARKGFAVTTADGADLTTVTRALYVGATGDVRCELVGDTPGTTVTLVAVPAGSFLPLRIRKIWATGTTATSLVGLY